MSARIFAGAWLAWIALAGCEATGRSYVEIPVHGAGAAREPLDVGDWTVELSRADVAFGPLWLCATEAASPDHCDASVLELREVVVIDGTSPELAMLGTAEGITGTVRSAMYDHGIAWLPTWQRPRPDDRAPDGHSARFEGRATHADGRAFSFTCDLDLVPIMQGSILVGGRRLAAHEITSGDEALVVRIDPRAWWARVDFERLAASPEDPVRIEPGEPDYDALAIAITAGAPPAFEWARP